MEREPMASHTPFWSRVALAVAATSLGLGLAFGIGPLFVARSETTSYAMLKWTEPVSMALVYLSVCANAAAFVLALICLVKQVRGVPWLVLALSSLGLCYCGAHLSWLLFGVPR
jgi:hypothetical protein